MTGAACVELARPSLYSGEAYNLSYMKLFGVTKIRGD